MLFHSRRQFGILLSFFYLSLDSFVSFFLFFLQNLLEEICIFGGHWGGSGFEQFDLFFLRRRLFFLEFSGVKLERLLIRLGDLHGVFFDFESPLLLRLIYWMNLGNQHFRRHGLCSELLCAVPCFLAFHLFNHFLHLLFSDPFSLLIFVLYEVEGFGDRHAIKSLMFVQKLPGKLWWLLPISLCNILTLTLPNTLSTFQVQSFLRSLLRRSILGSASWCEIL